ncbi:MAG: hypothetical protein JWN02_2824 [Acidobacteria bacterium]|nr:hypothetical protein [Acidobacteriota bacterium]
MTTTSDWDELARAKLVRVLGASEGETVFASTLAKLGNAASGRPTMPTNSRSS